MRKHCLLMILFLIFAFQAENLTTKWFAVILLAIPILIQVYFNSSLTYLLMRTLRFSAAPALGAAITFMLSGPMVLLQYNTANVLVLFPLLLTALEYLRRAPSLKNILLTAMTAAMR